MALILPRKRVPGNTLATPAQTRRPGWIHQSSIEHFSHIRAAVVLACEPEQVRVSLTLHLHAHVMQMSVVEAVKSLTIYFLLTTTFL